MATTTTRTVSSRSTFSSSTASSAMKESRPAWYGGCSPGRPNSFLRSNSGSNKPLVDLKFTGNAKTSTDSGATKLEKPVVKKNPSPLRTTSAAAGGKVLRPASPRLKPASPRLRPASPRVTASSVVKEDPKTDSSLVSSKAKVMKAPVKNETPPPSRPKKPTSALVTPTSKGRKPLATIGTPPNQGIRDRGRTLEETPTRKLKEKPSAAGAAQDANKVKDKSQPFSAWGFPAGKSRRGSTPGRGSTPNKPPVKSMFLSPQASKKNVKKEPLRKSAENHGIWVGQVPTRKRAAGKREADSGMPPPAQPTNSPEIPKRGSRELSGEGARGGYFGAGPMVAPEGCGGFVRDRRKCKPRGTLVVGGEGLSVDSDSSGVLETSIQIPLPSVASVEWMDRMGMPGLINSSSTSSPQDYHDVNQSHGGNRFTQELLGEEFRPQVKQPRIGAVNKRQVRPSRQSQDEYQQMKSSYDVYTDSFYHQLKQARSSAGEGHKEVQQSAQSETGFYRPRSSQDVFGDGFYQQLQYARNSGGEAYRQVRQSRESGDGVYQTIVRSSQVFLQQLRQSQLSTSQFSKHSDQSTHSEGTTQNVLYKEGIIQNSLYAESTEDKTIRGGKSKLPESAGCPDVTIEWRDGLPDSEASSAKQSPDEWKTEEFVAGSVSFGTSWVPPANERRVSGGAKSWLASDSTWYGFSPITPEFHRASQLPEGGSKLIDALVAGSVRRRIMDDQNSSEGNPDLPSKSLIQSLQLLNVDGSVNKSHQSRSSYSRSSHSRSSRGSQEAGSLPFSFSTRSYSNIAELEEAEQGSESLETYMCRTASPIEPVNNDDVICEGALPLHGEDMMCQTASPVFEDIRDLETASLTQSDDVICQTASPLNEVCSAPTPNTEGCKWTELESTENRWDERIESEDRVEYASPVAGDYLSPIRAPSRCSSPERSARDVCGSESNTGVRASRRKSISKTLEELMRHNLHI